MASSPPGASRFSVRPPSDTPPSNKRQKSNVPKDIITVHGKVYVHQKGPLEG